MYKPFFTEMVYALIYFLFLFLNFFLHLLNWQMSEMI